MEWISPLFIFCRSKRPAASTLQRAIDSALFGEALGVRTVTFNATTKQVYIEAAKKFLDALEGHRITAVIQVHEGRSIETVDDLTEVLDAFDLVIISISEDSNNTDREVLV